jgi:hypothetical protein
MPRPARKKVKTLKGQHVNLADFDSSDSFDQGSSEEEKVVPKPKTKKRKKDEEDKKKTSRKASKKASKKVSKKASKKVSKKTSKKASEKVPVHTLLQAWGVEQVSDDDSGSDFKAPSKPSRGSTQSKVAGEVTAEAHKNARERTVKSYELIGTGRVKLGGKRPTDPKRIDASDRVIKHPNQSFKSKPGNVLYCVCCSTEVSLKQSSVITHIHGNMNTRKGTLSRHETNLKLWIDRQANLLTTIHDCLPVYDAQFQPVGQTLPATVRAYRVEVLCAFAKAGIPMHTLHNSTLCKLLERDRTHLGGYRALQDLCPMLGIMEMKKLGEELAEVKYYSLMWDATFRFAEVFAMLLYFFDAYGRRQKRLVGLRLLKGSLTSPETCGVVMEMLSKLPVTLANMLAGIFDRCATNYGALNILVGVAPDASAIGCMSHTGSHVGEKANLTLVTKLVQASTVATHSAGFSIYLSIDISLSMYLFN